MRAALESEGVSAAFLAVDVEVRRGQDGWDLTAAVPADVFKQLVASDLAKAKVPKRVLPSKTRLLAPQPWMANLFTRWPQWLCYPR